MKIPICEEFEKLASQYPLSYREIYALNVALPITGKELEPVIQRITIFGMSVSEFLIKMCHLNPMTVQELLYQPCECIRSDSFQTEVNNIGIERKYYENVAGYLKNKELNNNKKELT